MQCHATVSEVVTCSAVINALGAAASAAMQCYAIVSDVIAYSAGEQHQQAHRTLIHCTSNVVTSALQKIRRAQGTWHVHVQQLDEYKARSSC